jgi:hypothetical protein
MLQIRQTHNVSKYALVQLWLIQLQCHALQVYVPLHLHYILIITLVFNNVQKALMHNLRLENVMILALALIIKINRLNDVSWCVQLILVFMQIQIQIRVCLNAIQIIILIIAQENVY